MSTPARYHIRNLDRNERPMETADVARAMERWDQIVEAGGTPHCLESFKVSHTLTGWTKPRSIKLGVLVPDIILPIRLGRRR